MIKATLLSMTMVLVFRQTVSDCLTASQLTFFNLTSAGGLKKDNATDICGPAYNTSGYCATPESVKNVIDRFKENFTRKQLEKMGEVAKMIKGIAGKFGDTVQGAFDFKGVKLLQGNSTKGTQSPPQNGTQLPPQNGTQQAPKLGQVAPGPAGTNPPPPSNSTNGTAPPPKNSNGGNPPPKNSNGGNPPPRMDKNKLNLSGTVLNNMQDMKAKMQNPGEFLRPMMNDTIRQECTRAQFRLLVGTMCMLSSGDGSQLVKLNANGEIEGIYVNTKAGDDVIKHCNEMLQKSCDLFTLESTVVQAVDGTLAPTPSKPEYCNDLTTLKACAENPNTCTDTMRKLILEKSFAPFSFKLIESINTSVITNATTTLENSLGNSTTSSTRRLAESVSNVSFIASSTAPNPIDIASKSQISVAAVEDKISVPDSLKSSAGIFIALVQALVMFAMN